MGMANSLDRIFEAMGSQLREVVAPRLDDGYARSQVMAMAELLANLATRVEWRCDQLHEVVVSVRDALDVAWPDPTGMSNSSFIFRLK